MKQLEMFKNIKKLLDLKIETNRKLLLGEKNNEEFEGQVNLEYIMIFILNFFMKKKRKNNNNK